MTKFVMGVDEAGRGSLAGPVVAAAVICLDDEADDRILAADSKKLTEAQRETVFDIITSDTCRYITSWASFDHQQIDESNILKATMGAMHLCVAQCAGELVKKNNNISLPNIYGIIDGNRIPPRLPISARPLVKGDALCYSVALSSIIAKVNRDRIMRQYHKLYPEWDFAKNKGYPTREHLLAIDRHGASPIHRMSFKPLKGKMMKKHEN